MPQFIVFFRGLIRLIRRLTSVIPREEAPPQSQNLSKRDVPVGLIAALAVLGAVVVVGVPILVKCMLRRRAYRTRERRLIDIETIRSKVTCVEEPQSDARPGTPDFVAAPPPAYHPKMGAFAMPSNIPLHGLTQSCPSVQHLSTPPPYKPYVVMNPNNTPTVQLTYLTQDEMARLP
jgi:hypothetical protein